MAVQSDPADRRVDGGGGVTRDDSNRNEQGPRQRQSQSEDPTDGESSVKKQKSPAELRKPLLRDRIRDGLGLSPQQWYVIETFLLVAPYPLFVFVYVTFPVNETLFVVVTLLYSLAAIYVGFLS